VQKKKTGNVVTLTPGQRKREMYPLFNGQAGIMGFGFWV
jgi:hypothetical protein